MDANEAARILDEMGTLLELQGENPFRCRAYHNAANSLRALELDLGDLVAEGKLGEVPGIGETLVAKITQLVTTGKLQAYEQLLADTPPGLAALLRVPGLGPKKIKTLRDDLKISSLADLRIAGETGKLASLKGFGEKTQAAILEGIAFIESVGDRILQSKARRLVAPIVEAVEARKDVFRVEVCGSLRRRAETIGDLDVLFSALDPVPVLEAFVHLPQVAKVLVHGPTKASVRLAGGVQCDLRGVTDEQFPFALHYFTGSKDHNIAMRRRAIARGLKLNEYSLEGKNGAIACKTEEDVFKALGLEYIPPELREDRGEIDLAERGELPNLIETKDLTGTFHCHSEWSDGTNTLEEMANAAKELGMKYLGIADHSRSAGYAGGLSIERVRQQWLEIDALNKKMGPSFRVFKGTECDILGDGSLDFPDEILDGFDYVVASVHSLFRLPREEMTRRIVRAVRHPKVTMLGHPTGRLLLTRDAYALDLDAVLEAAAESKTMIEINADPHRLDLDANACRKAKSLGVVIVINPDAHTTDGLLNNDYGIGVARKAGLEKKDVFNTQSLKEIVNGLERSKNPASKT